MSNSKSDANETGVCQGDEGLASERGVRLEIACRHRKRKLAVLVVLAIVAATAAGLYSVVTWRLTMERRGGGAGGPPPLLSLGGSKGGYSLS